MSEFNTSGKSIGIVAVLVIIIAVVGIGIKFVSKEGKVKGPRQTSQKSRQPKVIERKPVVDYGKLEKDTKLGEMMQKRKTKYGLGNGVDMIVKSDESLKIGDTTVSMQDIIDKKNLENGVLIEKNIVGSSKVSPGKATEYGIHVVLPGDNIWNIHFAFLNNYFSKRGIPLSPRADEAGASGYSSGVGKLLKFSENMVYIYNIKNKQFETELNMIHPLNKIVIYNMAEIFSLLDQINYGNVNRIEFDGENIWIPAEQ